MLPRAGHPPPGTPPPGPVSRLGRGASGCGQAGPVLSFFSEWKENKTQMTIEHSPAQQALSSLASSLRPWGPGCSPSPRPPLSWGWGRLMLLVASALS